VIDPAQVIKFNRTQAELEEFWLFCTLVAGKTALTQAKALDAFLVANGRRPHSPTTPFGIVRRLFGQGTLLGRMQDARLGQYTRLSKCWEESLPFNLRTALVDDLEKIHGVGPKTARMFVMQSRPDQRYAALDTHVLKHLRANGIDAPLVTPSSPRVYRQLEGVFLALADAAGMNPTDYDMHVWRLYSRQPAMEAA
jgi:hypothetical protein